MGWPVSRSTFHFQRGGSYDTQHCISRYARFRHCLAGTTGLAHRLYTGPEVVGCPRGEILEGHLVIQGERVGMPLLEVQVNLDDLDPLNMRRQADPVELVDPPLPREHRRQLADRRCERAV